MELVLVLRWSSHLSSSASLSCFEVFLKVSASYLSYFSSFLSRFCFCLGGGVVGAVSCLLSSILWILASIFFFRSRTILFVSSMGSKSNWSEPASSSEAVGEGDELESDSSVDSSDVSFCALSVS